jgi:ribonuclease D
MTIRLHRGDLPNLDAYKGSVAIDTETLGLDVHRDRLCVVQLSPGDGSADVVQIAAGQKSAPNIQKLLADPSVVKIFHYGRFDIGVMFNAFGVMAQPVYCTKIASRLVRTYTDRHGLKDLTRELLGVDLSKQQQSSDWGAAELSDARRHAGARRSYRARRRVLRLSARTREARSGGMGRRGHFLAFGQEQLRVTGRLMQSGMPVFAAQGPYSAGNLRPGGAKTKFRASSGNPIKRSAGLFPA